MKFFSLAAMIAVVSAATPDLGTLPTCSAAAAAGCGVNDLVCQCTTGKDAVTRAATPCVTKNCAPSDQALTASAALTICNAVVSGSTTSSNSTGTNSTSNTTAATTTARPSQTTSNAASSVTKAAMLSVSLGLLAALVL